MSRKALLGAVLGLALVTGVAYSADEATEPSGDDGSCGSVYNYRSGSGGNYTYAHTGPGGVQAWAGYTWDSTMETRKNTGEIILYSGLAQNAPSGRHAFCGA